MTLSIFAGAVPVIAILVGAAFVIPADAPVLPRQIALCSIGIGGIALAERLLFGTHPRDLLARLGFITPRPRAVLVALLASLPMWMFLPLYGRLAGVPVGVAPDWPWILLGVVLVNGIAEEVIHRAFVFGHLRATYAFGNAATIAAAVFAAQHVYLLTTIDAVAGMASVLLAAVVAFPLAFLYERGGRSISAPALLHSSSNAPPLLFTQTGTTGPPIVAHMVVVLMSMCLSFAFNRWLERKHLQVLTKEEHVS